jgi:hypothetical protein
VNWFPRRKLQGRCEELGKDDPGQWLAANPLERANRKIVSRCTFLSTDASQFPYAFPLTHGRPDHIFARHENDPAASL